MRARYGLWRRMVAHARLAGTAGENGFGRDDNVSTVTTGRGWRGWLVFSRRESRVPACKCKYISRLKSTNCPIQSFHQCLSTIWYLKGQSVIFSQPTISVITPQPSRMISAGLRWAGWRRSENATIEYILSFLARVSKKVCFQSSRSLERGAPLDLSSQIETHAFIFGLKLTGFSDLPKKETSLITKISTVRREV